MLLLPVELFVVSLVEIVMCLKYAMGLLLNVQQIFSNQTLLFVVLVLEFVTLVKNAQDPQLFVLIMNLYPQPQCVELQLVHVML
jgi:hypothetical protein